MLAELLMIIVSLVVQGDDREKIATYAQAPSRCIAPFFFLLLRTFLKYLELQILRMCIYFLKS
jgi:hypothetical protein